MQSIATQKHKTLRNKCFVFLFMLVSTFSFASLVSASTILSGTQATDLYLTAENSPYVVQGILEMNPGRTLHMDPGVIVKFQDETSGVILNNAILDANGTETNKVYFTSIKDDSIGGDTNGDGDTTTPAQGDWKYIYFAGTSFPNNLSHIVVRYAGATNVPAIWHYFSTGPLTITDSSITDNLYVGLTSRNSTVTITNSQISNNTNYGVSTNGSLTATNNYWGDPTGPTHTSNPTGLGDSVSDGVMFEPWLGVWPPVPPPAGCTADCFSNVLFLPGIMGSRLYESGLNCGTGITGPECGDKELWASVVDTLQEKLLLDENGKTVHPLFTKDDTQKITDDEEETGILDEFLGANFYKSFIADLREWKIQGVITDYAFIPYDWRLSLEDIITNGKVTDGKLSYAQDQDFSESFILEKLQQLQESSKSKKVTIIAHSNGGLVTKALIQKLKDTNNPLYDKIDKVIFVGVPQVGTPEALVSMLHGRDLGEGFVMKNERQRFLAENFPTAYNLLPSASYFTMPQIPFPLEKIVTFPNGPIFNPQIIQYGTDITDEAEMKEYVLGSDARIKPQYDEVNLPNIGNPTLYNQAQAVHQVLDSWTPSINTKVVQVAGWGEETIAGLDYRVRHGEISFKPRTVVDGDATVVVPSALWMPESVNIERWWVDLIRNNTGPRIDRDHKDILEIQNLRNFIESKVKNLNTFSDSEHIVVNNTSTLVSDDDRLHYTLHSPLTLGITDSEGRYTGMDPITKEIKNEIPDVNYEQIGDVQFLSVPKGVQYSLVMHGYEEGVFSLDVDEQQGNDIVKSTIFEDIPNSTSTIVTMDVPVNFDVDTSVLKIDTNGDNTIDKTLEATPEGETIYDDTAPEFSVSFNLDEKEVQFKALDDSPATLTKTKEKLTAEDNQGNISILDFKRYRAKKEDLKFSFNKVTRNGTVTNFPNTYIQYNWDVDKKNKLKDLDTRVIMRGEERYTFNYKKEKNSTVIKKREGKKIVTTTRPGFVSVTIKTNGTEVEVNY